MHRGEMYNRKGQLYLKVWLLLCLGVGSPVVLAETPPSPSSIMQSFENLEASQAHAVDFHRTEDVPKHHGHGLEDKKFKLEQLNLEGVTAIPEEELMPFFSEYLGKDITPKTLFEIADKITNHYRNQGYILSRAYVPVQEIRHGHVSIKVMEGFVSKVVFRWMGMAPDNRIKYYASQVKLQQPLHNDTLERALLLIKDLPGIKISTTLRPSKTVLHASELVVIVARETMQLTLDVSDDSPKSMGPWRIFGGMTFNSYLGMDEQITLYGAGTSYPFNRLILYGAEASFPVFMNGTRVHLKGELLRTKPHLSDTKLVAEGRAETLSMGMSTPLVRTRPFSWFVSAWFDFKTSTNKLWRLKKLSEDAYESLRVGRIETSLDLADEMGGLTTFMFSASQGFDGLGARTKGDVRREGRVNFSKVGGMITRLQNVWGGLSLYGFVRGQYGPMPLLSLERFNYGGPPYNHVYESGFLSGDSGVEGKIEVRYTLSVQNFIQFLQFFAYFDHGVIWNKKLNPGDVRRVSAKGTGVGVRGNTDLGVTFFVEYGMPAKSVVNGLKVKEQLYVGLGYNS